ncbi:hypothetical protein ACIU1J_32360 [Azospirillum doebereinerae]|uniref:hypothetical protein n=1 Tax=Azospirillum doebereinerae TaxID=92933 RepID=UPI001EE56CFD|nr:hypothetical protein [Azospirillum doebereinerae]MCG5243971.1 hypothetical protein [Azospirillum doebereinerae]
MAKLRAPGEPVVVPSVDGARRYILRTPNAFERQRLRGETTALGARQHGMLTVLLQLLAAVRDLLPDPEDAEALKRHTDRIVDVIERVRRFAAAPDADRNRLYLDVRAADRSLLPLADILRQSPLESARVYVAMARDEAAFTGLYGLAAARLLLCRVEGEDPWEPARPGQAPPERVLDGIEDGDFDVIAVHMLTASSVSEEEAKNSDSPSSGSSAEGSSTARSTRPRKTPSSKTTRGGSTSSAGTS